MRTNTIIATRATAPSAAPTAGAIHCPPVRRAFSAARTPTSTAAAPVAQDQRPIIQNINPAPGMSEAEVGRIAGERLGFAMRSA